MPFFSRPSILLLTALAGLLGSGCARESFFQPDARLHAATPLPASADNVTDVTAGRQYANHGRLFTVFFGRHHRQAWATPVTVPVLDVRTAVGGGLTLGKLGGGFNSTSLSTADTAGAAYVIRTVDKDPARATPPALRNTFVVNYLRDNVSATHPFAGLVVPPLAEAVGVAHASPRLFYVPPGSTQLVGDSLRKLRGQLVMVEEKFNGKNAARLPGATNIVDSRELFAQLYAAPMHRADAGALLRARLLDAWLGDWDRHAGQWTWAEVPDPARPGRHLYHPVPKDRDMVFYRADDGVIPWLLTRRPFIRHWTTFKAHYTDPVGLMENGHFLDERLLTGLSRGQFQQVARQMQAQLTDSIIAQALRRMPAAIVSRDGAFLTTALRARREALPAFADEFYRNLARHVVLGGTAQAETFLIRRYPDSVAIEMLDSRRQSLLRRTFRAGETKSIALQGLGGNDTFYFIDAAQPFTRRPQLRIYGGPGKQYFFTDELTNQQQRHYWRGLRYYPKAPKKPYDELPEE